MIIESFVPVFEPDGVLWQKIHEAEDGTGNGNAAATSGAAGSGSRNLGEEEIRLEPPSPSKPVGEASACLEKRQ